MGGRGAAFDLSHVAGGRKNGNEAVLEVALLADDGKQPLSEDAANLDDHARGLISDLTDFNVRKRKPSRFSLLWLLLIVVAIAVLMLVITRPALFTSRSQTPNAANTDLTAADQASTASDSGLADAGPISGTWDMYWTNVNGDESVGFVVRFTDDEYGTIDFPYDERAYDAVFDMTGDQVSFGFARDFDVPSGTLTEWSSFEGTLVTPDEIRGEWLRDDWECWSDPNAGCKKKVEPAHYPSRLVRQP